ncbi:MULTISPECIES: MocR-like pyridoxine biosynthesis transcription factor PdxR [Microbacterium]|uniref:MocR-like pyridoxine biosynthesis transcription factor PdxR n=1 Tax=Microbacterium TaxID=33882 RepID=UPI001D174C36|nr:PLP-dependent aminotransferase family protein [Microbacterium testaceum]MCC4250031.1 PLP-dependent aminotransferase family protein [Microbacterium testaceum]
MISSGILDRSSPVPLHVQLTQGLRAAIVEGRLAAGETLPSSRSLAEDLGVARGTVVAAFETLTGEGYLVARPGARTTVAVIPSHPTATVDASSPQVSPRAPVIDLRPGRPGTRGLSDAAWRSAWRRASAFDPAPDVDDEMGLPALREEIARHLARTRGLSVDPSEVIVTAGTSDALLLAALALPMRGPGRFGVENPGYPRVRTVLARAGVEAVPLPVTLDGGLDLDAVEQHRDLDAVVVTPHHHYPLGSRMDATARARLTAWARDTGTVVIEDDYDSEFPHGRAPLPPLRFLDPQGVVLIGSVSKLLSPALRCGWMIASGAAHGRLAAARADLDLPVSGVLQHAIASYLANGSLARHTARRRRDYRHRRRLVLEALQPVTGVELAAVNGGLHAVVLLGGSAADDGRGGSTLSAAAAVGEEDAVVAAIAERGVLVSGLSGYAVPGAPADLPAGVVLGYAEPTTPHLVEALAVVADVLRARRPGQR